MQGEWGQRRQAGQDLRPPARMWEDRDKVEKPVCPEGGWHRPPDVTASERRIAVHKGFSGGKGQAEEKEQLALRRSKQDG